MKRNQQGMVSIMVTMIIMIVISLVVIGFAQLSRREQRQALDRQLSTQAFYAAETGINHAVEAIREQGYRSEKTNCGPDTSFTANNVLSEGVEYTCLLIDPTPLSLEYSSVDTDKSAVIPLQPESGSFSRISLSWQDKTGGENFSGCLGAQGDAGAPFRFPAIADWPNTCNAGVLRIDLVPRDSTISRSDMTNRTLTAFLYPRAGGSTPTSYTYNVSNVDRGTIIPVNCNAAMTPRKCTINIDLTGAGGVVGYYLRTRSIYRSNALTVTGYVLGNNQPISFVNAQAQVDSTGKANDVLRRISVRVPLSNIGNGVPEFAIQTSDSLCKRFGIAPNVSPTPASGDPACQID